MSCTQHENCQILAGLHTRVSECECCPKQNEKVILRYGNMWMCEECFAKEQKISAENLKPENQQARVNEMNARLAESHSLLERSKQIDMSIQIKTDIFNAATIPTIELKAAINADENIPPAQKDFAYAKVCLERYLHFKEVVFGMREELLKKENEMRAWQVQVRTVASQLSNELREQFKQADLSYQPQAPKTVKPSQPKTGKKFEKGAVYEAAEKFGVPAPIIQTLVTAFADLTPEKAAQHYSNKASGQECVNCAACVAIEKRKSKMN